MSDSLPETVRLVVVEDHASIRELLIDAFKTLKGFQVVGEAATAREGLELCLREKPDVVVMDVMLPDENGLDSARAIRRGSPKTKILIFSATTNAVLISRALEQGVHGYIEKSARFSDLVSAVRAVAANAICFGQSLLPTLQQIRRSPFPLDAASRLTARECTILAAIAGGKSSKAIAAELGLSVYTVNNHRRRIKAKTGLRGTSDLTLHALRLGLVNDPAGSAPAGLA